MAILRLSGHFSWLILLCLEHRYGENLRLCVAWLSFGLGQQPPTSFVIQLFTSIFSASKS